MLFNSSLYGVFLIATFAVFWLMHKRPVARAAFLTLASYGFYFYGTFDSAEDQGVPLGPWGWSFLCLGIIFVGSTLDFWIGRALGRIASTSGRRALLLVSIAYYLGVLSIFKYFNFAAESWASLLAFLHLGNGTAASHLRLVLPFGISFFTFETMSYTIDVYRRDIEPCRRYLDYLLFVSFFPHLVAGPIVRPQQMLPQLAKPPVFSDTQQARGLFLIATGLVKKIVIGDVLAASLVNRAFDNPERFSSLELTVAIYAYAFQIYADFSGYTDVAIGSARLFGYELPPNFLRPYASVNLQEFWHRWHISLSSWLRDYLYIPLGGSRGGPLKTYRNLLITMVLGGLWHGASWNFVIWGALHGLALAATRMWQRTRLGQSGNASLGESRYSRIPATVVSTILTFHFVCFCWVFFRAPTFDHALVVLSRVVGFTPGAANLSPRVLGVLALAAFAHMVPKDAVTRAQTWFGTRPALVQGIVLAAVAMTLHAVAGAKPEPFVYGQF